MRLFWVAFVLVLLIIGAIYLGVSPAKTSSERLSNITELYSSFTTYMKAHVNYHLLAIDCEPNEYYYNESICFICNGYDACFDYGWVTKGVEGYLMNPKGNYYLTGNYSIEDETSFNTLGFSKSLGCGVDGDISECAEGVTLMFDKRKNIFSFPESINKTEKIENVFGNIGLNCTFSPSNITDVVSFSCKSISGLIREGEVII